MKVLFLLCLTFFSQWLTAQNADNAFEGYFEQNGDQSIYSNFSFDGNGKVLISEMDYGDYFTRNDSLIIYPDKSVFIFKIQKNKIIGQSQWVDKGIWIAKKDSTAVNNRKDPITAKKNANLLAEYYDKTKNTGELSSLFSTDIQGIYEDICNRGLSKACLNLFGVKLILAHPEILNRKTPVKNTEPNAELIALSQKIIALGDAEGYTVLGSYYYALGLKTKAYETWDKGASNGSLKSGLTKAMTEIED